MANSLQTMGHDPKSVSWNNFDGSDLMGCKSLLTVVSKFIYSLWSFLTGDKLVSYFKYQVHSPSQLWCILSMDSEWQGSGVAWLLRYCSWKILAQVLMGLNHFQTPASCGSQYQQEVWSAFEICMLQMFLSMLVRKERLEIKYETKSVNFEVVPNWEWVGQFNTSAY